jgi:purine-binding chemotaxis protein CheW
MSGDNVIELTEIEDVLRRVEQLRRSFDADICAAPPEAIKQAEEYLLVTLAGERYAYPLTHALEIIKTPTIVPVPSVPSAILGIINFRGQVLSVSRIHGLLGLTASEAGARARIIVTKRLPLTTGILVDGVEKIVAIGAEEVHPLPVTISDERTTFLRGEAYLGDEVVFLLDMEKICESEELRAASSTY